jgi:ABC-2 type transport system permease protein
MRAFWKPAKAELKLFTREPLAVFFILAFPLILLWLNGSRSGDMDRLLPGYMALILATVGLTQLPSMLATYRERGILRRLATTPVPPATVLGAQLVVHLAASTIAVALLLAVAGAFFDVALPQGSRRRSSSTWPARWPCTRSASSWPRWPPTPARRTSLASSATSR